MNNEWFSELFGGNKAVIGVVHVGPLPGSPFYERGFESIVERAVRNAIALEEGGVSGVIVENFLDRPYPREKADPATLVSMTLVVKEVVENVSVPVGVNVLRNCWRDSLAIAFVLGCPFIRVNVYAETVSSDQGIIGPAAYRLQRYRKYLGAWSTRVMADVHVKHAAPIGARSIDEVAKDAVERGCADAIIVSGSRTGIPPTPMELRAVKNAVPTTPVIIGSGLNPENAKELLRIADGAIVGTYFKREDGSIDVDRVRRIASIARETSSKNVE